MVGIESRLRLLLMTDKILFFIFSLWCTKTKKKENINTFETADEWHLSSIEEATVLTRLGDSLSQITLRKTRLAK